jgi:hypothetical protein
MSRTKVSAETQAADRSIFRRKRCLVSETYQKACQDVLDCVPIGVGEQSVEAVRSMSTMRSFVQPVDR